MNRSEETAQKHICRLLSHCLHFNGSNSNKQYNWLPIVLLLFKQAMTSGTRDSMKYIRRGEEGVRASDLGPSENQATLFTSKEAFFRLLGRPVKRFLFFLSLLNPSPALSFMLECQFSRMNPV